MIYADSIALIGGNTVALSFDSDLPVSTGKPAIDVVVVTPEMANKWNVAFWGGDNKYPQNVTEKLSKASVARSILDFKAKALFGQGIVYGTITGRDDKGYEQFTPAAPGELPMVDKLFFDNDNFYRYFLEFNQDWTHFGNCFPRLWLTNDGSKVYKIVHEESSDCRYQQMAADGKIKFVLLSKYWAEIERQYLKADENDSLQVRATGASSLPNEVDNNLIKKVRCLDMYNALDDLTAAVAEGHRQVILPVNYPSPGKTYYQSPVHDALRLSGWLAIASKIPEMLQILYSKAFNLRYHIQIPDSYLNQAIEGYEALKPEEQKAKKKEFTAALDKFLSGSQNAYKTLVTYFKNNLQTGSEVGKVSITTLDDKVTIDKEVLLSSVINQEIAFALQMNPAIMGAGAPGKSSPGSGSDIREAFLVFCAMLYLERQIILEPLRLAAIYNGAPKNIAFRFLDLRLTTLDENKGAQKELAV